MAGSSDKPIALILHANEKLGDAILRIPLYRALKLALPGHAIVCASAESTVWLTTLAAARSEFIDEILLDQPLDRSAWAIRAMIKKLGKVDFVFDLRSNKRTRLSYLATAGLPLRYLGNSSGFLLRHGLPARWEVRPPTNAQRYHRMVEIAVGRLLPFESWLDMRSEAVDASLNLVPAGQRFIGLSPGPVMNKFWAREKWLALARHISHLGITPVFLLGPQEADLRAWIEQDDVSRIIDSSSVSDPALLPWLFHALADRAVCIVAAESGLGHLAATRGGAVLTLAGPTKARIWRPLTSAHWVVEAREFGSRVTADIPLDAVTARIDEIVRWSHDKSGGTRASVD